MFEVLTLTVGATCFYAGSYMTTCGWIKAAQLGLTRKHFNKLYKVEEMD